MNITINIYHKKPNRLLKAFRTVYFFGAIGALWWLNVEYLGNKIFVDVCLTALWFLSLAALVKDFKSEKFTSREEAIAFLQKSETKQ